jgi:hypothetical protein
MTNIITFKSHLVTGGFFKFIFLFKKQKFHFINLTWK